MKTCDEVILDSMVEPRPYRDRWLRDRAQAAGFTTPEYQAALRRLVHDGRLSRKDTIGQARGSSYTRTDHEMLREAGFFPWGHDSWINESDLGTVMSTEDALRGVREGA